MIVKQKRRGRPKAAPSARRFSRFREAMHLRIGSGIWPPNASYR